MRRWNINAAVVTRTLRDQGSPVVRCAVISYDGKLALLAETDQSFTLWNVQEGRRVSRLVGHTKTIKSIAFSPDGKMAASCGEDDTIRLWNLGTSEEITRLNISDEKLANISMSSECRGLAFSPKGMYLLRNYLRTNVRPVSYLVV